MASATARTAERLPSISRDHLVTAPARTAGFEISTTAAADTGSTVGGGKTLSLQGGGGGGGGEGGTRTGCVSPVSTLGPDRRILLGVGTYLIDTPRDPALLLRQKFISFQEQHRGVVKPQTESLPDIVPYRVNPKPEDSQNKSLPSDDVKTVCSTMVDMATSPVFPYDENWNLSTLDMVSPDPSCAFGNIFLTARDLTNLTAKDLAEEGVTSLDIKEADEGEVTSRRVKDVTDGEVTSRTVRSIRTMSVKRGVKDKTKPTIVEPFARSVSFSERPRRRCPPKSFRDLTKLGQLSNATNASTTNNSATTNATSNNNNNNNNNNNTSSMRMGQVPKMETPNSLTDRLPMYPESARTPCRLDSPWKRASSSVSDLTEIGSIFSWHDKEFERRTVQSLDMITDNIGPTSFFQMKKSRSLLDVLRASRKYDLGGKDQNFDDTVFQRHGLAAPLGFKRGPSFTRDSSLESEDVDKGWKDIVNTQIVDDTDYDKFASRRKPVTPSRKKNSKSTSAKAGKEPKNNGDNNKLFPLFVNLNSQAKKFGRALQHNRKFLRSK